MHTIESPASRPPAVLAENRDAGYATSRPYAWYLLGLLLLLMIFGQMDRMVIGVLFPQLKQEWNLSDVDLGFLAAATYWSMAAFVIPAAILVDRWSRVKAITLMALIWTGATVACGMAANFLHLFLARFGIGAGEGGYNAGAVSMIAGIFPERLRTTATSMFIASGTIGSVIGLALGGYVATHWGWRAAFFAVALPGFLVVLLFALTARDFKTVALEVKDAAGLQRKMKMAELLRSLFATPSLVCMYAGLTGILFAHSAMIAWTPSLFTRVEGLSMNRASLLSAAVLLAAAVGAVMGGMMVDRWKRRRPNMILLGPALFTLASFIGFLLGFLFLEGNARLAALLVGAFFLSGSLGPIFSASQTVIHAGLRATTVGIINVVGQLFGGLGPIVTGMLSDTLGLPVALALVILSLPLAALVLFVGSLRYEADAAKIPKVKIEMTH